MATAYKHKLFAVPPQLFEQVAEFRRNVELSNDSEAWRLLVRKGLQAVKEEQEILQAVKDRRREELLA